MNLHILKGNVGQDPTIHTFEGGGKVAKFTLATSEKYKNRSGETVTETEWHNIVFYGPVCDVIEKHVKKGMQLLVIGRSKMRSYTDKNKDVKYIYEIIGDKMEFCGPADKIERPASLDPGKSNKDVPKHVEDQQQASIDDNFEPPF